MRVFKKQNSGTRLAVKANRITQTRKPLTVEMSLMRVGHFVKDEEGTGDIKGSDDELGFMIGEHEFKGERDFGGESRLPDNLGFFQGNTLNETLKQELMDIQLEDVTKYKLTSTNSILKDNHIKMINNRLSAKKSFRPRPK